METVPMKIIARIHSDFRPFGIPRPERAGGGMKARVVFEPDFRSPEAVRGLEGFFSHLADLAVLPGGGRTGPHCAAARLGGNTRMGVFATLSPFRPNAVGLSSVRLERVEPHTQRLVLHVAGARPMDGTIFDIKLPLPTPGTKAPEATGGLCTQDGLGCWKWEF